MKHCVEVTVTFPFKRDYRRRSVLHSSLIRIRCLDPLDPSEVDDSLTVELTTNAPPRSTWRTWVPHLTVTNNPHVSKNKEDVEEEEDIF